MANWNLIGELTVTNLWQQFPSTFGDTFRVTTTILNQDDWHKWKFRSAAYLRFIYGDGSASVKYYIRVLDVPTVYVCAIPDDLRNPAYSLRTPEIIRASRYLPITPNNNFAQWKLKLEKITD
ncbi:MULTISPECIES: hypothetical protein [unclassified Tolypothrix]|uniref:hypothetical protein n=1 Tax=unclassified Tolypothrix TaxID=2649714 RepID=UPI0005EAC017|nr:MULTISPECIES: hypothetical protein [unclassified Tolypothrix]BAY89663.1 hypothetical protein NIES3275_16660 [Microchaete diplosiphon NIES-3275]EKE97642.1 hypothetical protein FDUTEX481_05020 [Tolypothrix sp. PCC 7601]MBE9083217.1 hypothetical protein [Tolypothrix sp. LEGE 11397]UYD23933.1 hypothetical protein HGR01_20750 [Tolypothrix sp. PCC 7712]UYD33841.1 hypothetical protein HG267_34000 [Tolypothrix sp. PCC 7601]